MHLTRERAVSLSKNSDLGESVSTLQEKIDMWKKGQLRGKDLSWLRIAPSASQGPRRINGWESQLACVTPFYCSQGVYHCCQPLWTSGSKVFGLSTWHSHQWPSRDFLRLVNFFLGPDPDSLSLISNQFGFIDIEALLFPVEGKKPMTSRGQVI